MKQVRVMRIETNPYHGTFGVMTIDGIMFCLTLEPYSRDNVKVLSCIPAGQYICREKKSSKYGDTYEITNIQNRDNVLFHWGNIDDNTKGCIILGEKLGRLGKSRAVLNSKATFKTFLAVMIKQKMFLLTIKECY